MKAGLWRTCAAAVGVWRYEKRIGFGRSKKAGRGKSFFSLLELLVVLSVIVILLGLFLPVLNSSREHAFIPACINNFRQQQFALANYLQSSDDMFPALKSREGIITNEFRWYSFHLWLMEDSIPRRRMMIPSGTTRMFRPDIDPFNSGNSEAGKAMPLAWVCPARLPLADSLKFASAFELQFHRYGLVRMYNYSEPGTLPKASPVVTKVSKLPSPGSYSHMAESGWEPLLDGIFEKHASTPYLYGGTESYGNLDGLTPFGHKKGFAVSYIDGHVKFHTGKRTSQKSGQLKPSKIYATRVVASEDL